MHVDVQVCQQFFVNTLNINKGRVYYFFEKSNNRKTVTPGPLMHGKHTKKVLDERLKQEVRDHINKFPRMESHYCRKSTKKQYLDPGLNLTQMYRLYATESDNPLKISAYRNIFDYEFNLAFFHSKKDRCEKCVENEQLQNPSEQQIIDYAKHHKKKTNAHSERNKDREVEPDIRLQNKSVVAEFDLENVFQLPIANASILFYLRKFATYNLTVVVNKIVYNVFWNEFVCGRAGTHLASALVKALKRIVLDNPEKEELTLWSDSCVPQNRNSYMSAAIQGFLNSNHSGCIQTIDHKYSEAGHGEVQNVDCAHSVIEKFLRGKFIYSPVSLVKQFHKIPPGKSEFVILEMDDSDYFDYEALAQASKYSVIPYKKVVQLTYKKNQSEISFKLDFNDHFITSDIVLKQNYTSIPDLQELELHSTVTAGKMADIQKMYGIMPEIDRVYYQNGFKKIMGKLSPETPTLITKKRSEVNDSNEGHPSHVVVERIIDNKTKKATRNTVNGKKKLVQPTGNSNMHRKGPKIQEVISGGGESKDDHLDDSKNLDAVRCDKTAKKPKSSGRTAGTIFGETQVEKSNNVGIVVRVENAKMPITSGHMVESSMKHFGTPKNSNEALVEVGRFSEHFENSKSKPLSMQVVGSNRIENTQNGTKKLMPRNNRETGFPAATTLVDSTKKYSNKSRVRSTFFRFYKK